MRWPFRGSVHQVTDACAGMHCETHQVDEIVAGSGYLTCGECYHLYPSPGSLRRAYRRRLRQDPPRPRLFANEFNYGLLGWLKLYLFVRADRITFCQECSHDF
jgi:hypothetical protein